MTYSIKFYADFLDTSPEVDHVDRLPTKEIDNVWRAQCPGCKHWVHYMQLVDIRGFPATFLATLPADAQNFACDGCWTGWERNGHDIGDGQGTKFNEAIMYQMDGAPQALVDDVTAIIDARIAKFQHSLGATLNNRPWLNLGSLFS